MEPIYSSKNVLNCFPCILTEKRRDFWAIVSSTDLISILELIPPFCCRVKESRYSRKSINFLQFYSQSQFNVWEIIFMNRNFRKQSVDFLKTRYFNATAFWKHKKPFFTSISHRKTTILFSIEQRQRSSSSSFSCANIEQMAKTCRSNWKNR